MKTYISTKENSADFAEFSRRFQQAEAIVLGAGAGLSTAGGLQYSGERFHRYFHDFHDKYGITNIYEGGFFPFSTKEELWGWWARHIYYNRYEPDACAIYQQLFHLLEHKNYFVLTTNVDHQFQKAGFPKEKLFYTQGDYGQFQCAKPCTQSTFSNETIIKTMIQQQKGMEVERHLFPTCPNCGGEVSPYLRKDETFVESTGWHNASLRYQQFLEAHQEKQVLFLELGVGYNTPSIIKFPFWQMTHQWEHAFFVSFNQEQPKPPKELKGKSLFFQGDLAELIDKIVSGSEQ